MGRPRARELTERELQVMHAFWGRGGELPPATVSEVRDALAGSGPDLAYTTVATLVRILNEKGFLEQTNNDRPFRYRPARSYEEVSRRLLGDVLDRVFGGSRELLLVRLLERERLTGRERDLLRGLIEAGDTDCKVNNKQNESNKEVRDP
jgi:predicted transcriptional regulator